jgi:hypothetical protein
MTVATEFGSDTHLGDNEGCPCGNPHYVVEAQRVVPLRPKQPSPVACNTCLDHKVVSRIRGGLTFSQPCPDCNGGEW